MKRSLRRREERCFREEPGNVSQHLSSSESDINVRKDLRKSRIKKPRYIDSDSDDDLTSTYLKVEKSLSAIDCSLKKCPSNIVVCKESSNKTSLVDAYFLSYLNGESIHKFTKIRLPSKNVKFTYLVKPLNELSQADETKRFISHKSKSQTYTKEYTGFTCCKHSMSANYFSNAKLIKPNFSSNCKFFTLKGRIKTSKLQKSNCVIL